MTSSSRCCPEAESTRVATLPDRLFHDIVLDVLQQEDLLLETKREEPGGSPLAVTAAIERDAQLALAQAEAAARAGVWKGTPPEDLHGRIRDVASRGLAQADTCELVSSWVVSSWVARQRIENKRRNIFGRLNRLWKIGRLNSPPEKPPPGVPSLLPASAA